MARIPLYGYPDGKTRKVVGHSLVDDDLLPLVEQHSWFMKGEYATAYFDGIDMPLHYFVWEHHHGPDSVPDDLYLDHLNQDKLDNHFANLVLVGDRVKQANTPMHRNNTSGFKGVSQNGAGRFSAKVGRDGKLHHLGIYATAEEAAYAVNLGYAQLHPEVPTPNPSAEALLSPEQKSAVEDNFKRLTRPDRQPHQS